MPTFSIQNINKQAPKGFRRVKKAILILTLAANAMIASYGFPDIITTRIQLWCTIGIGALLEAIEALLKDDGDDTPPPNETPKP
jgi:hypothetical protein